MIRVGATAQGAYHGMTGGATSNQPVFEMNFNAREQEIWDKTFGYSANLGSLVTPLGTFGIKPTFGLAPSSSPSLTIAPGMPMPALPVNNDRVNSTSNSESSLNQNATSNQTTPSKVEKTKETITIGDGKYTKTTEVRPSKQSPGQSRAEIIKYKNSEGKTIKVFKDSYDRGNVFQHRKFKLPRYEPSYPRLK